MIFRAASAVAVVAAVAELTQGAVVTPKQDNMLELHRVVARQRKLQAGMESLCSVQPQGRPKNIDSRCTLAAASVGNVEWPACCTFDVDRSTQGCRQHITTGQYCDEGNDASGCSDLGADDIINLQLTFSEPQNDELCCKSCTCYGDPECVSFDGTPDVWIVCDARGGPNSCRMTKNKCLKMKSPSGGKCQWLSDRLDSKNWPIGMIGSPCQPDLTREEIRMNMHTSGSGNKRFKLDLVLGERGIIQKTEFQIGNKEYTLDANDCFDRSGSNAWTGDAIPEGWVEGRDPNQRSVTWAVFDSNANVLVKLLCARAVEKGTPGNPRINVQEVSVPTSTSGSGFCFSGSISDKKGDNEGSAENHAGCVQNEPTSLQACKFLVDFGYTPNELTRCAHEFCSATALDFDDCSKMIGSGHDDHKWLETYCEAILANGSIPPSERKTCHAETKSLGYDFATQTWGKGHKSHVPEELQCATSISDYELSKKPKCSQGVYIDILKDGEWVPRYFVPSKLPPCGGKLSATATQARDLFTHSIAFRQCDVLAEDECAALGSCQPTYGVSFSFDFTNNARSLQGLLDSGVLTCVPNQEGSTTWCLPGTKDFTPVSECECKTPQGRPRGLLQYLTHNTNN